MERYTWISVKSLLPERLEIVFISNGKGQTWIGCRTELFDKEDRNSWCWARSYDSIYEQEGKLQADCYDEDLDVKYWHRLPSPPNI